MRRGWVLFWVLAMGAATLAAAEDGAVVPGDWLVLGPVSAPLPAFHGQPPGKVDLADLLREERVRRPGLRPAAGDAMAVAGRDAGIWTVRAGETLDLAGPEGQVAWLAGYLRTTAFAEVSIAVTSHHLLLVEVDGKTVATKDSATGAEAEGGEGSADGEDIAGAPEAGAAKADLELEPGVHLVLVKVLRDPESVLPWTVAVRFEQDDDAGTAPSWSTDPSHPLELAQVLDVPQPRSVAVSADGSLAAVGLRRILPGSDDAESWFEVRRTADGRLVRTFRGGSLSGVSWAPAGHRLGYVTRSDGRATLWLADLDAGSTLALLEGVEHLGSYRWVPDASAVIYSVSVEPEEDKTGTQRLFGLQDRQANWRTRSYLHEVRVDGGARRRLTAGDLDTSLMAISPDGTQLLFTRSVDDYSRRPYVRSELWLLDRESLEVRQLDPGWFLRSATWSPDGDRLLVVAGPSAFDGAGRAVPDGTVANDYDGQLYLLDPDDGAVEPLSRDFDPAIQRADWHHGDGRIYVEVTEGSRVRLYRLDPATRRYEAIETGVDVVEDLDLARDAPVAVYVGSGAVLPPRVMALGLDGGPPRELDFPGAAAFEDVKLGEVEDWSFRSRRGVEIQGRVYYPPGFDPSHRWPAIIYYYGGTSPTTRDFGGRYPKNLWAAHGYVVYVLQPSGATGFGQGFSALHVNDWGNVAGGDILEGVDRFLEAHPFVDPERLGCIGASYGGFMTEYLLTRTDRFAAGISHAGISFLGSYWGEGYWGYAYSGVATADSFPWNRTDLYVESSPLFHADRIRTPLLLLHGTADTNVPPGESEQLYTALKLLGREVEYVRIPGQNHHILKHDQRVRWSASILAWFDRWLKDEPAWWEYLYPDPTSAED
ncbi:MAG: S9 family peptidase [Acidobacteriota bacterium]|jgi:dipeptidyl aminopeptidase/acylaminoacyl peptidase